MFSILGDLAAAVEEGLVARVQQCKAAVHTGTAAACCYAALELPISSSVEALLRTHVLLETTLVF